MIETTNLKLEKAELHEPYSLSSQNANLDKIDEIVAKKAWGTPVKATMQNGWSGNLYSANLDTGLVSLYATGVTSGTIVVGTIIATLLSIHAPIATTAIPFYSSTGRIYLGFQITTSGEISYRPPQGQEIASGQGITFNIVYRGSA